MSQQRFLTSSGMENSNISILPPAETGTNTVRTEFSHSDFCDCHSTAQRDQSGRHYAPKPQFASWVRTWRGPWEGSFGSASFWVCAETAHTETSQQLITTSPSSSVLRD